MAKVINGGLVCGLILALGFIQLINATVHMVGGESGWTLGVDFKAWACGKKFVVGDTLVFRYKEGYGVEEVTEKDFKACDRSNAIIESHEGYSALPLNTPGPHYYICGFFDYCQEGMNMTINVEKACQQQAVHDLHHA